MSALSVTNQTQESVTIARTPKIRRPLVKRQPKRRESPAGTVPWRRKFDDLAQASDVQASDVQASDVQASDVQASDVQASDVQASDVQASDVQASDAAPEVELTPEQEHRRQALQSMLSTSNARYQQAIRKRGPVFAAGIDVKIKNPTLYGQIAKVLDADYIESRAQLAVPNHEEPLWLPFTELGLPD